MLFLIVSQDIVGPCFKKTPIVEISRIPVDGHMLRPVLYMLCFSLLFVLTVLVYCLYYLFVLLVLTYLFPSLYKLFNGSLFFHSKIKSSLGKIVAKL